MKIRLPENELYPFPKAAEPVILPALDDVVSISVISGDITATSINEDWFSEVMYILMDMEPTSIPSKNDSPNVEEYTMINVNCSDGMVKTVFSLYKMGVTVQHSRPQTRLGIPYSVFCRSIDRLTAL